MYNIYYFVFKDNSFYFPIKMNEKILHQHTWSDPICHLNCEFCPNCKCSPAG